MYVYRTLSSFMETHFDGVAFAFDKNKDTLIDELSECHSFAATHQLIAKLEEYAYFSAKEVNRMLAAAVENNQFGGIVEHNDVSDFSNRVAVPRLESITEPEQIAIVERVINTHYPRSRVGKFNRENQFANG